MSLPNVNDKMEPIGQGQVVAITPLSEDTQIHCAVLDSHDNCNHELMSDALCKVKCAASCSSAPAHISIVSFNFPFSAQQAEVNPIFVPFYTRSISPELRPPLV